jgi:two-component system, sensor histidine kinase
VLFQFYSLHLDGVVFSVLCLTTALATHFHLKKTINHSLSALTLGGILVVYLAGLALAQRSGHETYEEKIKLLGSVAPLYAYEMEVHQHHQITLQTSPQDPIYLYLIETEKRWLDLNPLIADVYTLRLDSSNRLVLIVDSETDYDHNGLYEGPREARTAIGEVYEDSAAMKTVLQTGQGMVDQKFQADRWGLWISAYEPIRDPNGKVEALLGVDYPAQRFVTAILQSRFLSYLLALAIILGLLASGIALQRMQAEIMERRRIAEDLLVAKKTAETASQAKSDFISFLSHEGRNPLGGIMGYALMLGTTPLTDDQRRFSQSITACSEILLRLFDDVLDFSKIEAGRLDLEKIPFLPAQIALETADISRARIQGKPVEIIFQHQLEPGLRVMGDPLRYRQILLNLVGNAGKFTVKGAITIHLKWQPDSNQPGKGTLTTSISDTGVGMSERQVERLFQRFAQESASTARHHGGSGLGLAISQQLVELMGGQIHVESLPGQGSRFWYDLTLETAPSP